MKQLSSSFTYAARQNFGFFSTWCLQHGHKIEFADWLVIHWHLTRGEA